MWFPKHSVPPQLLEDERGHFIKSDNRGQFEQYDILIDKEIYDEVFSPHGYFIINVFEGNVQFRMLCWRCSKNAQEMIECKMKNVKFKNKNPLDLRRENSDSA